MAHGETLRFVIRLNSEEENIAHGKDILPFQLDFSHMRFERRGEMCVRLKCSMRRRFHLPILRFFRDHFFSPMNPSPRPLPEEREKTHRMGENIIGAVDAEIPSVE
jgi:hypothetical protein